MPSGVSIVKMSPPCKVFHVDLSNRDLASGLLETSSDLVPPDATKQDDVAGEVIADDIASQSVEDIEGWVLRTEMPVELDQRI